MSIYCLEKRMAQKLGTVWKRYATCGSRALLDRVRMGQPHPERWRVSQETPRIAEPMSGARSLEQELQKLFGEASYRLEVRPCTGKYHGHTDYTLVFGSGRRLYIGLDERNYINGLQDQLRAIRHFRAHQEENTRRINMALSEHDTPFSRAEVEVLPYPGTSDLTLYAVVILSTASGTQFVYRTATMHGCLVGYEGPCFAFEDCMAHLLKDACGKRACIHPIAARYAA